MKGPLLEVLAAWQVVRTCIFADAPGGITLKDLFIKLLPDGATLPPSISNHRVLARRALRASCLQHLPTPFHAFVPGSVCRDVVLYGIDSKAGVDVMLVAAMEGDAAAAHTLVCIQAKAQKEANLLDALRAASPAWQYTVTDERTALCGGEWADNTRRDAPIDKRAALTALAAEHPLLFDRAVRVVLSVTPYRQESLKVAEVLNASADAAGMSPVVLAVAGARALGPAISDALRTSCAHTDGSFAPVSHTDNGYYWLPQSVASVSAALDARSRVSTFSPHQHGLVQAAKRHVRRGAH
ncbi:hypothetical protein EON66_07560 [archaeon]|nr:MAG: hypothetical protein EON66_07560 [archaeon]